MRPPPSPLCSFQIPAESLPRNLGGKCDCPAGGCSLSDAGPWNTAEGKKIVSEIQEENKEKRQLHEQESSGAAVNGTA
jgi:hypothetical protein